MKQDTLLTTLGRSPEDHCGVVNQPVYRASTILFPTLDDYEGSETGAYPYVYGRTGTPSTQMFEVALAQLDGDDHAIVTSSGLSAIVTTMLSFLSTGDHVLVPDNVYGSARKFCSQELVRMGVEVTYYDPLIGGGIAALMKPNTKLVYCESPGSLTFEVQDIPAIARAAHAGGAVVAADNTWATPMFMRACEAGVDVTIHSCTKYIGGHSDIVMGLITTSRKYYPQLRRTYRNLGCCPGADEIYLAQRGLRTMAARLKIHQETGLLLAHWFKRRPEVVKVLHPAFPECPGHAVWKRDFTGSTGLFSVLLKSYPRKALAAMVDHMELLGMGFSWGGYESLILPFRADRPNTPSWTHTGLCLRIHAGLENPDDIIADLEAGFDRLNKAA